MKNLLTIVSSILFLSILIVPADDAPLCAYLLWLVWCLCALLGVKLIWKRIDRLEEEDENLKK